MLKNLFFRLFGSVGYSAKSAVLGMAFALVALSFPVQAIAQDEQANDDQLQACGGRAISIARMQWPTAAILAEIHARVISSQLGCETQIVPGDLSASLSSMATTGQPAIAPEMWISRVVSIWNSMSETQQVRALASSFESGSLEGWYVPQHVLDSYPDVLSLEGLRLAAESQARLGQRLTFVSCPPDWACALINRNLLEAAGIADLVNISEPANRFEMDSLIAQAVSATRPLLFYYWQPNALFSQFDMREVDLGAFDQEAFACLAVQDCADPQVSDFVPDAGSIVVSDWIFDAAPQVSNYLLRASMPLDVFDQLLAWQAENAATPEQVADYFVQVHTDVWSGWLTP